MLETHLSVIELKELYDYLASKLRFTERDKEFLQYIIFNDDKKFNRFIRMWRQRKKYYEYEEYSSFGRNYREIIRNLRGHLNSCDLCLNRYTKYINLRASKCDDILLKLGLDFREENDYFGILDSLKKAKSLVL